MSWLDLLIVFVFVFSILSGIRKGLVFSLAALFSFVISFMTANAYYERLGEFLISNTKILEEIKSLIPIGIQNSINNGASIENLPNGAHSYITQLFTGGDLPFMDEFLNAIAKGIVHIISFLLIFFIIRIILSIFVRGINSVFKLPILNFFNKIGGGVIGLIRGIVSNIVIVSILYTIAMLGIKGDLVNEINNSILASYFYIGYLFY
ncbi:colicin V production protein [Alkalibaculum bacchi]|uniref:Colicin V production protein n=1 Tax=Alkalibaculum bacchi TaxID=645887 RepID=A0A366I317_9FIRM|nr:CvpA family protein [Alkalibaculum bacchi]RBP62093.1 colicin V production protein [Alkalibaculum bacchi]